MAPKRCLRTSGAVCHSLPFKQMEQQHESIRIQGQDRTFLRPRSPPLMPWFRVDDGFYSSRKVTQIPRAERWPAIGLWTIAGTWSAKELTDGFVPDYQLEELGGRESDADKLVHVGLWVRVQGGYEFSNWGEYQPTKAEIEAQREKEAERKRKWRESRESQRESRGTDAGQDAGHQRVSGHPDPTRPDPTRPTSTDVDVSSRRDDVDSLCTLLADLIEGNGSKRPTINKQWRDATRLLIDKDGREYDKAERLLRWCQADEFWRANILSMPKFRDKYDQLRLAANKQHSAQVPKLSNAQRGLSLVDHYARLEGLGELSA